MKIINPFGKKSIPPPQSDTLTDEVIAIRSLKDILYDTVTKDRSNEALLIHARKVLLKFLGLRKIYKELNIEPYKGRGAVAEVMLRILCEEWLDTYGVYGYYIDGLLLKHDGRGSQLDGLLVTDKFIACIECKSYYGSLVVEGRNIEISNGDIKQPWQQNLTHIDTLKEVCPFLEPYPIHNIVYIFSNGYFDINNYSPSPHLPLMLNSFAFTLLNQIYEQSEYKFKHTNLTYLKQVLQSYIPTVADEKYHIQMLNIMNGTPQDDFSETPEE